MKTEKVAFINNYNYVSFPEGINTIEEFVEYLNSRYNSFVSLDTMVEKGCVAPYFIEDSLEIERQYWNPSNIRLVCAGEIHILSRDEYMEKLKKVVAEKCVNCVNYSENTCEDDYKTHMEHIRLDGECYEFEKK